MSVLTFQLTKLGIDGYEIDWDNHDKYIAKQTYSHYTRRKQRQEEADKVWQQAFEFAKADLFVTDTKVVHNFDTWKEEKIDGRKPGAMTLLSGHEDAQKCVAVICERLNFDLGSGDRQHFYDFTDAWARSVANAVANQTMGLQLPTTELFRLRGKYLAKRMGFGTEDFEAAIKEFEALGDDMLTKIGG